MARHFQMLKKKVFHYALLLKVRKGLSESQVKMATDEPVLNINQTHH